jgi:hypothetical protein
MVQRGIYNSLNKSIAHNSLVSVSPFFRLFTLTSVASTQKISSSKKMPQSGNNCVGGRVDRFQLPQHIYQREK